MEIAFYNFVNKYLLNNRMKALYWGCAAMLVSEIGSLIMADLTAWRPDGALTVFAGLVLAQITKYLNTKK